MCTKISRTRLINVEYLLYQVGIGMEAARLRARAGGIGSQGMPRRESTLL